MYQNISKCLKLSRPPSRSLSIVFRTWSSTVWSIEFLTTATDQSDCYQIAGFQSTMLQNFLDENTLVLYNQCSKY